MNYLEWSQFCVGDEDKPNYVWNLSIQLTNIGEWDLRTGKYIKEWDTNITAVYDEEVYSDYPFTTGLLPVYSTRLKALIDSLGIEGIQYLPLRVRKRDGSRELDGYYIANYLNVIDCLNRERSVYQVWTKDSLLFWEKRSNRLGTFRDVRIAVMDLDKIGDVPIFRVWGWEMMVVVREDVKRAIEKARITGCVFHEIEVV